jgi:hypothetical protein
MTDNIKLTKPVRSHSSLVRPKYSAGLLLQDDDLTAGVSYTRNLSRLMFRTLFGCGVLCGLRVGIPEDDPCGGLRVPVAKGVALSCAGDPIEVPADQTVQVDSCGNPVPGTLWFAVRHIETCCVPRTAQCPPDDDEPPSTCTRERDGFEISVFECRPCSGCGCPKLVPRETTSTSNTDGNTDGNTDATATGSGNCPPEQAPEPLSSETQDPCLCNLRTGTYGTNQELSACMHAHYQGECPCDCCDCEWIVLAVATRDAEHGWSVDHSVRRFVRPVLMRDPVVAEERAAAVSS